VLQPSSQVLHELARHEGHAFVSCYVPFARSGKDVRQNAIHFKNCQRALAAEGAAKNVDARTLAAATKELAAAADAALDPRAPRAAAGFALFAHPDGCVTLDSMTPFAPVVTVADRFYLLPLMPFSAAAAPLYVVTLSRQSVRLIGCADGREVELPRDFPKSLTDAVGTERRKATLQRHAVGTGSVFHGHGEGDDDLLPEIETFCRQVANRLGDRIDRGQAMLLLAGDVQITSVFRRAAGDLNLAQEHISGNHDRTSAAELCSLAQPLLSARRRQTYAELRELYESHIADRRASDDAGDISAAARAGRIDTLLLNESAVFEQPRRRAARHPHAIQPEGPFNTEAVLTLRCGGEVRLLPETDMPTAEPQAAIYRF
jgi:hypothetical protein